MTTTQEQPVITVGGQITRLRELEALPEGAVIRTPQSEYRRYGAGLINQNTGGKHGTRGFRLQDVTLVSLPDGGMILDPTDYSVETPLRLHTVRQFKALFRTLITAQSQRAGIGERTMRAAFTRLHIREPDWSEGMPIAWNDYPLINMLPRRSTVEFGDPAHPNRYMLMGTTIEPLIEDDAWTYGGHRGFTRLLGTQVPHLTLGRLVAAPGIRREEWVDEEGTFEEMERVLAFKAEAVEVGGDYRDENDWCATYQSSMRAAGVNPDADYTSPWVRIPPHNAAGYREGALFRYEGLNGAKLYVRDDASTNEARTRGVGSDLPGHWSQAMTLLWDGVGEMHVPVTSAQEMDAMPVGTVLGQRSSANQWTKVEGGEWTEARYSYRYTSNGFDTSDMEYREIPTRRNA